jgi:hypothetical protein
MTEGRVWWPIALVFILMFPGFTGCIALGQNGIVTLTILLLGWWQLMRGREALAGVCWGILAFKPVWATTFLLVPLVTGRWRMAGTMIATGLAQIVLTLPLVGWRSWLDWLQIGQMAGRDYLRQENWIYLSRDLLGIPRRWLLHFDEGLARRLVWQSETTPGAEEHWLLTLLGWGLWTAVVAITLGVVWRCRRQRESLRGPLPAFVLLGAMFSCYHFMYYDILVAGLPVLLLFTEPRRYFQLVFWHRPRWLIRWWKSSEISNDEPLTAQMWSYHQPTLDCLEPPPMPLLPGGRKPRWAAAPMPPLILTLLLAVPAVSCLLDPTYHFPPSDTFALLGLWAWCGYRLLVPSPYADGHSSGDLHINGAQFAELGTDVRRAHERFADQHGADAGRV